MAKYKVTTEIFNPETQETELHTTTVEANDELSAMVRSGLKGEVVDIEKVN